MCSVVYHRNTLCREFPAAAATATTSHHLLPASALDTPLRGEPCKIIPSLAATDGNARGKDQSRAERQSFMDDRRFSLPIQWVSGQVTERNGNSLHCSAIRDVLKWTEQQRHRSTRPSSIMAFVGPVRPFVRVGVPGELARRNGQETWRQQQQQLGDTFPGGKEWRQMAAEHEIGKEIYFR